MGPLNVFRVKIVLFDNYFGRRHLTDSFSTCHYRSVVARKIRRLAWPYAICNALVDDSPFPRP